LIKREDLFFSDIIKEIRSKFKEPVFIFLQEELQSQFSGLMSDMEKFVGGRAPEIQSIDSDERNKGVGYFQAKILLILNRYSKSFLNPKRRFRLDNAFTRLLKIDPRTLCQTRLSFISKREMVIPQGIEDKIVEYYEDDWKDIQNEIIERRKKFGIDKKEL